ncbi:GpE family phage tail protein [Lacibacterium aquatile]|uniref:GpE family phage tail protein n=1 Tax=Lacibacterium aquatile TaxID=1168082 RepID=A0ABW5DX37_9PROT
MAGIFHWQPSEIDRLSISDFLDAHADAVDFHRRSTGASGRSS